MSQPPEWFYNQSAVIPYRIKKGQVKVLLITSRKRKRWIIPKGIIEPNMTAAESAMHEAWEEAGIKGVISSQAIGEYQYDKWENTCTVEVFLLQVEEIFAAWPEDYMRDREWVSLKEAARRVREKKLKKMIRKLPKYLGN